MKKWFIIPAIFFFLGIVFLTMGYLLTGDDGQESVVGLLGLLSFCSFSGMCGSLLTGILK